MHSGLNVGRKEILESVLLPLSRSISQEIVELMMALVQNLVSCMCVGCVLKHSWSKGCFSLSNSIPYYISKSSVKKSIQDHYEIYIFSTNIELNWNIILLEKNQNFYVK